MAATAKRTNESLLRYLSAAALAVVAWSAMRMMPFYPGWLELTLAVGVGAITLVSPSAASIVFVFVLSVPVIAADFAGGVLVLVAGLVATQYLSMGKGGAFVLAAVGVALLPFGGALAAVAVGGYLLGRSRGATVGAVVAGTAIVLGILLGFPTAGGVLVTGGVAPGVLSLGTPPADPLAFGWLVEGLNSVDAATLFKAFAGMQTPALVATQIALWALAGAAGSFVRTARSPWVPLAAVSGVVVALTAGQVVLDATLSGPLTTGGAVGALVVSLPLALATTAAAIWLFPVRKTGRGAVVPQQRDVDDLLRVIASAEDELAARHQTEAVVMITDMKSFSAMTEELGSVESAKVVQRHRDLLMPVIAAHSGKGAPTGGDGLVAAFRAPSDAVAAAIAMQQALDGYTGSDRSPHELSVRIGIASGEVVLDAAGVPFLGAALNMAARVMDLADGGRIMITSYVSSAAGLDAGQLHRHGDFKLKNIAEPIPVAEVLWRAGMMPQEIRAA